MKITMILIQIIVEDFYIHVHEKYLFVVFLSNTFSGFLFRKYVYSGFLFLFFANFGRFTLKEMVRLG